MVYLDDMVGTVSEIPAPNNCTVLFRYEGTTHRALLKVERLIVNGSRVPSTNTIQEYLHEGSSLRFSCHPFETAKDGMYSWYITNAWRQHHDDHMARISGTFLGLYNCSGKVVNFAKRQGVIQYVDLKGCEHNVLFLGSKLTTFGKRLGTKHTIQESVGQDDSVLFDAVPCQPSENDFQCSWFASVVWKGKKPAMEYDGYNLPHNNSMLVQYKQVAANPKSLFFRGKGVVMRIINDEFGLALVAIKDNRWESVLFHRSHTMLFKNSIPPSLSLKDIFKKGDRLCIVAAAAPKMLITQWVATQVAIDMGPDLELEDL